MDNMDYKQTDRQMINGKTEKVRKLEKSKNRKSKEGFCLGGRK